MSLYLKSVESVGISFATLVALVSDKVPLEGKMITSFICEHLLRHSERGREGFTKGIRYLLGSVSLYKFAVMYSATQGVPVSLASAMETVGHLYLHYFWTIKSFDATRFHSGLAAALVTALFGGLSLMKSNGKI